MTAFEVVADTFLDECQIEIVENHKLPRVVDEMNPFRFEIRFNKKNWSCVASFQCADDPEKFVTIARQYTPETVAYISTFYGDDEDSDDE